MSRAGDCAENEMAKAGDIDEEIFRALVGAGPCPLPELVRALPAYSCNQVFAAVARLSREGRLRLSDPARGAYYVSTAVPGLSAGAYTRSRG